MTKEQYNLEDLDHQAIMQAQNHYIEDCNIVDCPILELTEAIASKIRLIASLNNIKDNAVINCLLAVALNDLDNLDLNSNKAEALGIVLRKYNDLVEE